MFDSLSVSIVYIGRRLQDNIFWRIQVFESLFVGNVKRHSNSQIPSSHMNVRVVRRSNWTEFRKKQTLLYWLQYMQQSIKSYNFNNSWIFMSELLFDVPVGFVYTSRLIWGSELLYFRSPKVGCCSILDDLSCSWKLSWWFVDWQSLCCSPPFAKTGDIKTHSSVHPSVCPSVCPSQKLKPGSYLLK